MGRRTESGPEAGRARTLTGCASRGGRCGSSLTADEAAAEPVVVVKTAYGWRFIFFVSMVFGIYLSLGIAYNVRRAIRGAVGDEGASEFQGASHSRQED